MTRGAAAAATRIFRGGGETADAPRRRGSGGRSAETGRAHRRYIRTQFADPAPGAREASVALAQRRSAAGAATARTRITRRTVKKAFYSDEEDESQEEEIDVGGAQDWGVMAQSGGSGDFGHSSFEATKEGAGDGEAHLDPDHRLALRSSLPLLKSRNSGVVLGVCALHYYCGVLGPATAATLGRALVRILRNRNEIQYVVLKSIASMAAARPGMFSPFINDFFVKGATAAWSGSSRGRRQQSNAAKPIGNGLRVFVFGRAPARSRRRRDAAIATPPP